MPQAPAFSSPAVPLPERFFASMQPQPVKAPRLLALNRALAGELGLDADWLAGPDGIAMLSGNAFPASATPVALAYAGHQFGHFSHQLGDGRALLVGEVIDQTGQRRDIQLKGSGRTPFSRGGDGRSALGPALREYLISEAMHALRIPTTRSLAVVATGDHVMREAILPGGIVTRVAASHLRVGTFQYFAARRDTDAIRILCRSVMERHQPTAITTENPVLAMLEGVIDRQASLIAEWMGVGFVHGVMNTDNMALSGETIDYGPCAFLDTYNPRTVFSSIDQMGRYAFGNQPGIAHWNLARFAETLLPVLDDDEDRALALANAAIDRFPTAFERAMTAILGAKLGLAVEDEGDLALAQDLLATMAAANADYTLTFRRLAGLAASREVVESDNQALESVRQLFAVTGGIDSWIARWRQRLAREGRAPAEIASAMRRANPAFIPRNHRVEEAIDAAVEDGDMAPFERLHQVLSRAYDDQPDAEDLMTPAPADSPPFRTFCGT